MRLQRWIAQREVHWQRLDELLHQVEKRGFRSLSAKELRELASLYRSTSGDLARARAHRAGRLLQHDLQQLTVRAYTAIYQGSRRQEWNAIVDFCLWGFPATVREAGGYIAAATVIFAIMGVVGGWYGWQDPGFLELMLPEWLIAMVRDRGELWTGPILGWEAVSSSNLAINNISVSLGAVGGGITAGLWTIYILMLNGLLIGTVGALVGRYELAYPFWAFVFPHGALELPAIFLAGGAGLAIARSLVWPGALRRADALKQSGTLAARLLFGIVPLLLIAGAIEGFISPSESIPNAVKYALGGVNFVLFAIYCQRIRPSVTAPDAPAATPVETPAAAVVPNGAPTASPPLS
ncbi:stage II sporulation protein M [Rubidibacter lacunae]|uniref:stage II sporulation protein M n=1 Tax=Rubidibacter lacunae TaxID=582514 RepID=UPI00041CD60C|nr:stage II sporulation protein M [Rubidibacter lacunae]